MEYVVKLILIILLGSCSAEVYNWNVRALEQHNAESDTDFGNDLKLQSALSNELQRDLLKISGKANDNVNKNAENTNLRKLYNDLYNDPVEHTVKQEADISKSHGVKEQNFYNDLYSANVGMKNNAKLPNFDVNTKLPDVSDNEFIGIEQNKEQLNRDNENYDNNDHKSPKSVNGANDYQKNKYNSRIMDSLYRKYNVDSYPSRVQNNKPIDRGRFDGAFHKTPIEYESKYNSKPRYLYSQSLNPEKRNNMPEPLTSFMSYNDPLPTMRNQYSSSANNQNYAKFYVDERQASNGQNQTTIDSQEDYFQLPNDCPAKESTDIRNFLGSNLFENTAKKCFTGDDVILLTIRKDFEVSKI